MKKSFWTIILISFLCVAPAYAERLHVQGLSELSTSAPSNYITFRTLESIELSPDVKINSGYVVNAKVSEIIPPKRLKRNAKFRIIPISYTDTNGNTYAIKEEFIGKYSPKFKLNKAEVAKSTALTVGDLFFKGVSLGYRAVEGAVKNEEGNRAKSSIVSVYKHSPLSYVEKGQQLSIKPGDLFSFTFKVDEEDEDEE